MASFLQAWPGIFAQEGGYVNDPNDPGGETYFGIARNRWPNWMGWHVVDTKPRQRGEIIPECEPYLQSFYKSEFWDGFQGELIINQAAARSLLYDCVNQGEPTGIHNAQAALGLPIGHWGADSLTALNTANPYA